MTEMANNIIENVTQCWGCGIFDTLFQVVSNASAAVYSKMTQICFLIFAVIFSFYVFWAVLKRLNPIEKKMDDKAKKEDEEEKKDLFYKDTIIKVIINSIVALSILGFGLTVPRVLSQIIFEPVANITLVYTQSALNKNDDFVNEHVTYVPKPMADTGIYRPQLRDSIIMIMKTTITEFQAYMKLGIAVMDKAFSWKALLGGIGALLKHVLIFTMGLYLLYGFGKLFVRFCFCFIDVIVAMAMFSFFFPLGIMLMSFKGTKAPEWLTSLGKGFGTEQIKNLVNSIVTVGASVIVYTVILVIIAKFFSSGNMSTTDMMNAITSGQIFESDISYESVMTMSFAGVVVLVYVLNYIYSNIPQVSKMILSIFHIEQQNKLSEQMANDVEKMVGHVVNNVKGIGGAVASGITGKELGKDEKKPDDKGEKK